MLHLKITNLKVVSHSINKVWLYYAWTKMNIIKLSCLRMDIPTSLDFTHNNIAFVLSLIVSSNPIKWVTVISNYSSSLTPNKSTNLNLKQLITSSLISL